MQKAFLQKVDFYRMELQARLPGHSIRAGRSSMAVLAHEVEGDTDEGTYKEDGKGQEYKIVRGVRNLSCIRRSTFSGTNGNCANQ
jgi:hypothetical protein